jgi:hypothetical protein
MKLLGILSDVRAFLLHRPKIPTLLEFSTDEVRQDYTHRIMQRLDTSVAGYSVLNIHQIGIGAPARFVFEELMAWDEHSFRWPDHMATMERVGGGLEHIRIFLLGQKKSILGIKNGFLGLNFIPLFEMNALKLQPVPSQLDFDSARYALYRCSGGYPIGIFSLYVRSSIVDRGEVEPTQVFFLVGFDFYGDASWSSTHPVNKVWEAIHNRVTSNVLNRFKELCEDNFRKYVEGSPTS